MNRSIIAAARKAIYRHVDDADLLAGLDLPVPRDREMAVGGMDGFMREEGFFPPDYVGPPMSRDPGEDDNSFSLADVNWPIPRRVLPPELDVAAQNGPVAE